MADQPVIKKKIRGKTREQRIHDAFIAEHIANLKNPKVAKPAPMNIPAGAHVTNVDSLLKDREEAAKMQYYKELQEKARKRRLAEEEGD
jgi:hypothetical protein